MIRVFIDANVLFSGSNPESAFSRLVHLISEKARPITSEFALEEARRNIALKRPAWRPHFQSMIDFIEIVPSVSFALAVELNNKDAPILCAAIRNHCDFLVTGDKRDFGHLYGMSVQGVTILPPAGMANVLLERA